MDCFAPLAMTGRQRGLRPQHVLLHLAAVEMKERHRCVVAQGAVARRRSSSASTFLVMACASASGFEPISTHTISPVRIGVDHALDAVAMLEASAVKKRVSKRRTGRVG